MEPFPMCKPHYKESGLAEYRKWTNGTPDEIRDEINQRVTEQMKQFIDGYKADRGYARVEGHVIQLEKEPLVYFIRAGDLVKIGTTVDLVARLKTFNVPNLVVLATEPGYYKRERELHQQFRELHHQGEWFRLEGSLVDYINAIRARHDTPPITA
ncbi:GIY-YIG nuclease family protein [Streptomyces rochei]|uniref:GIY-YIG nuclease family protein n=1 Tax=Streptomyces TaxID=1883 RepID=UPI00163CD302|nr:GIY-YIG nuclease family protein [Streptomyces sp. WAC08401]